MKGCKEERKKKVVCDAARHLKEKLSAEVSGPPFGTTFNLLVMPVLRELTGGSYELLVTERKSFPRVWE